MRAAPDNPVSAPSLYGDLKNVLGRAYEESTALLTARDGRQMDVVAWLSAHVAAFEHAVYPIAKRRLSDGAALLDADREVMTRLKRTLRAAERVHSGDVLANNLSADGLRARLIELVDEQRAIQQRIADALNKALDPAEATSLAKDYADALVHAPTRPHPHLRSRLLFHLDAMRDRVLDTMDGRHVPIPRIPKAHVTPSRWGAYLIGQPHDPSSADADADVDVDGGIGPL